MYHTTYHGLEKWFVRLFEMLGWIILAIHNNYVTKVKSYIESIDHLKKALEEKITETKSLDQKSDLKNLLYNLKILHRFVHQHIRFVQNKPRQKPSKQLQQTMLKRIGKDLKQQQMMIQRALQQ